MSAFEPRPGQAEVLAYEGGLMAVSAVPGSGKTATVAALAARLIAERLADDQQVLVVTYQNAAVSALRARIHALLDEAGRPPVGAHVRTLHSLAHGIVQAHPAEAGTVPGFRVVDERTGAGLLERAVRAWGAGHPEERAELAAATGRGAGGDWVGLAARIARSVIRAAKQQRVRPTELMSRIEEADGQGGAAPLLRLGAEVYAQYQVRLDGLAGLDFDDLVWRAADTLTHHPDLAARLRARWPVVLEDEAQDSVPLQEVLLGLLTGPEGDWVRVGDPNQAVTSTFTSADPRHLRAFLARADVRALPLGQSGRNARPVYELANHLVDWASARHPLAAVRARAFEPQHIRPTGAGDPQPNPPDGESGVAFRAYDERAQELADVAGRAARFAAARPDWTVGLLVPTNAQGYDAAAALRAAGVPFAEVLRRSAASRQVVEALGRVLAFLGDPSSVAHLEGTWPVLRSSNGAVLERADPDRVALALRSSRPEALLFPAAGGATLDAVRHVPGLAPEDGAAIEAVVGRLQRWQRASGLPADELVMTLAPELLAEDRLSTAHAVARYLGARAEGNPRWRLPDLADELLALESDRFAGLEEDDAGFEPRPGEVTLTTMHRAKGLEWDLVYLVGVDAMEFPQALDDPFRGESARLGGNPEAEARAAALAVLGATEADGPSATEEARVEVIAERLRLLYVGITRARRYLAISWSRSVPAGPGRTRPVDESGAWAELQRWHAARGE